MPQSSDETESIEIALVLEAIHRRYGYDLREYVPDTVRRRLHTALVRSGAAHLGELQHRLLHDHAWFPDLLHQLTVQVSDMFRDPEFYRVFRTRVAPVLRTYPQLKLWHAGCSSGEEVYATAILLTEEDLYERSQIYATDLSGRALDAAREGVYDVAEARRFAENYRLSGGVARFEDYCSAAYGRIAMHEELKRNLVFFEHNLASDYAIGEMHVVFCRNVLFYFNEGLRRRVLDMLGQALCYGGFLCLGATEAAPQVAGRAFNGFAAEARIFQRAGTT
jgi:chemotaxis protein methyltransferase CheR